MNDEFRRMQFLAGIITENVLYEEEVKFPGVENIDDIIAKELENAAQQAQNEGEVNEAVLTTTAIILGIPGIINGIARIIKSIKDKAPRTFDLSKKGPDAVDKRLNTIIKFSEKIDSTIDTPIRLVLKPFIKDQDKRNKIAKFLKAISLIIMGLGMDISKSPDILKILRDLAGNYAGDLATSSKIADVITKAKVIIPKLLK